MLRNIAFLIAIIALLLTACKREAVKEIKQSQTSIRVESVQKENFNFPVYASGRIVTEKEIKLSFKTGGIIASLDAEEGAEVKAGTLLAALNVSEIEAQVNQAKSGFEKASRDFNRAHNLYADSVATLEQFQNAQTALNVAEANLEIADFNLNHSKITAPQNGIILKRLAEQGEMIAPGNPVYLFGVTGNHWKIKSGLADRSFVRVRNGDQAIVTLDAWPDDTLRAEVSETSKAANPYTGTYDIELEIREGHLNLASGFVVNLEIFPSQTTEYFSIPIQSLFDAENQTGYVFLIDDSNKAHRVHVKIEGIMNDRVAVSSGLHSTDRVATEGASYIEDGQIVKVVQ